MRTIQITNSATAALILGGVMAGLATAQTPIVVEDAGVVASSGIVGDGLAAPYNTYGGHDLFYNYYTQGNANQAHAAAYVSPVPVPPWVGHTFYTYQPLYPHEMMHWHSHRYHNYYDNGRGLNRTSVHYYAPPVRTGVNYVWRQIQLPRP
jgi:hypothetical protein